MEQHNNVTYLKLVLFSLPSLSLSLTLSISEYGIHFRKFDCFWVINSYAFRYIINSSYYLIPEKIVILFEKLVEQRTQFPVHFLYSRKRHLCDVSSFSIINICNLFPNSKLPGHAFLTCRIEANNCQDTVTILSLYLLTFDTNNRWTDPTSDVEPIYTGDSRYLNAECVAFVQQIIYISYYIENVTIKKRRPRLILRTLRRSWTVKRSI